MPGQWNQINPVLMGQSDEEYHEALERLRQAFFASRTNDVINAHAPIEILGPAEQPRMDAANARRLEMIHAMRAIPAYREADAGTRANMTDNAMKLWEFERDHGLIPGVPEREPVVTPPDPHEHIWHETGGTYGERHPQVHVQCACGATMSMLRSEFNQMYFRPRPRIDPNGGVPWSRGGLSYFEEEDE